MSHRGDPESVSVNGLELGEAVHHVDFRDWDRITLTWADPVEKATFLVVRTVGGDLKVQSIG